MANEQRTEEWLAERAGKFTGSRFADVLARRKNGEPLKAYHDLIWQVVVERMTGKPIEGPTGFALQWGTDVEPYAREAYELETGNVVKECGFLIHKEYDFVGSSPDGFVGSNGGLEMKCPKSSLVHAARFIDGMPGEYMPQVQGNMWVTGKDWWDFVSYDPRMPESHRLFLVRIPRDEKYIDALRDAVIEANEKANALLSDILEKAA